MENRDSLGNSYSIFKIKLNNGKSDYWLAIKTKAVSGLPKSIYSIEAIIDYYQKQKIFLTECEILDVGTFYPRLLKYKGRNLAINESTEIETYTVIDCDHQQAYYKDVVHQIKPIIFDYENNIIFYKIFKND